MTFSSALESFISELNDSLEIPLDEQSEFLNRIRNMATEIFEPLFGQTTLSKTMSFSMALESFMSKINDSIESPSDEQKESLNIIRDKVIEEFEPFCQKPNSLTNLVRLFIRSKNMIFYKQIMELFRSDPEINPNWSIDYGYGGLAPGYFIQRSAYNSPKYLVEIINAYGSFEDLIYILERPGFEFKISNIKFTANLSTAQIEQLITVFKAIGVCQNHLSREYRNYFGFRIEKYNKYSTDFPSDHLHPSENKNALGPKCPCCAIKTNKNQLRFKAPANCKCRLHWDCALNLAVSFINQITNPNPLERKIISCPGCQGQIRPSFLLEIQKTFSTLENLMKYRKYLSDNFLSQYEKELLILIHLNLSDLNESIVIMNFQNHPNFAPCPKEDCRGFALIDPDIEISTNCVICHQRSRFIGKNRQLELAKESTEAKDLLASTRRIRPCPNCGKLIEKDGGCNSMQCSFCNSGFTWTRRRNRVNPEVVVHF